MTADWSDKDIHISHYTKRTYKYTTDHSLTWNDTRETNVVEERNKLEHSHNKANRF